jgi:polysaccharide deacetylase family protein (PEP-CTERM system associated)
MNSPLATAALSIDVEDWFHVENLKSVVPRDTWSRQELRVERNVELILAMLAEHGVRGTWFVLGWVAERLPWLVQRIAAAGHEIASHGYAHELVTTQTSAQFHKDVDRAKKLLEDIVGVQVIGYRAPCFSITDWSIDVLRDVGYTYDSSAFPTFGHDRYGHLANVHSGTTIIELRPEFHEVCVSTLPIAGYGLPWAGGGYFRLLPYPIFSSGIRRILARGTPYVFYIHPWEFDPGQPRVRGLRRSHAFRHYLNLARVESRFDRLLTDFAWTSVRDLLECNTSLGRSADRPSSVMRSSGLSRVTAAGRTVQP